MDTERRIEALERRCRRLTAALLGIGLVAGLAVCVAAAPSERDVEVRKLTCRELAVMDEQGRPVIRATVDKFGGRISMIDAETKGQVILGPRQITFLAKEPYVLARIGAEAQSGDGFVFVQSQDQRHINSLLPQAR